MTDHEHADILRAIADGEEVEWCQPNGTWRASTADEALLHIANGYADRIRIKPKPRAPREWWVNVYRAGYGFAFPESRSIADASADISRTECVHVREVLPDAEAKGLLERVRMLGRPNEWDPAPISASLVGGLIHYLERQI